MKKTLLIGMLLLTCRMAWGQATFFKDYEYFKDVPESIETGASIIEYNQKIVLLDGCRYDALGIDSSALLQIDTLGKLLRSQVLASQKLPSLQGPWKNEKTVIQGNMYGCIAESQDFGLFSPKARAIFKMRDDSLIEQRYFENALNLEFGPVYPADDRSFYALSVSYKPGGGSYLSRIDTGLNMLFEKNTGLEKASNLVNYEEIIVLDDKSVYVSYLEYFNSDPQRAHLGLSKFDSLGNRLWSRNLGFADHLYSRPNIVRTQDGNIAISYMQDTLKAPYFINLVPVLLKVDTSGNDIWRSYLDYDATSGFTDLIEAENGDFIGVGFGVILSTPGLSTGLVFRMNSNGELLWRRHVYKEGETFGYYFLGDVEELNGSIYACGIYKKIGLSGFWNYNAYLIKLSADGCFVENCMGDAVVLGVEDTPETDSHTLRVYPNPAGDEIYLANPDGYRIRQLELLDMQGRSYRSLDQADSGIEVGDLPPGVYILRIHGQRVGNLVYRRFVKR